MTVGEGCRVNWPISVQKRETQVTDRLMRGRGEPYKEGVQVEAIMLSVRVTVTTVASGTFIRASRGRGFLLSPHKIPPK